MSIYKFSQGKTFNMTVFCNWLNDHKTGTFLEDMTITVITSTGTNDSVKIHDTTNGQYIIYTAISSYSGQLVLQYNNGTSTVCTKSTNSVSGAYTTAYISEAILCNNGMIVKYQNNDSGYWYWNCLTVDEDGKLSLIITSNGTIPHADNNASTDGSFYIYSPSSSTVPNIYLFTTYGQNKTILVPTPINTIGDVTFLPYAYASVYTELTGLGLTAVRMNNEDYITNGTFYVKD
jgi:hypothetical protein